MTAANWRTQPYGVIQSLLFNNPHRVIGYRVRDEHGAWRDRAEFPAPVRRLYETDAAAERTCLRTVQFVHHMLIPPGGRHVAELHVHPDAEELVVVTRGRGTAIVGGESFEVGPEDVVYIPPAAEHELRNTGEDLLGVLFINVPTGAALSKLAAAQEQADDAGHGTAVTA
jgi:mannose-6-phosphate isomerase-like protein (cupin superfamily)